VALIRVLDAVARVLKRPCRRLVAAVCCGRRICRAHCCCCSRRRHLLCTAGCFPSPGRFRALHSTAIDQCRPSTITATTIHITQVATHLVLIISLTA